MLLFLKQSILGVQQNLLKLDNFGSKKSVQFGEAVQDLEEHTKHCVCAAFKKIVQYREGVRDLKVSNFGGFAVPRLQRDF